MDLVMATLGIVLMLFLMVLALARGAGFISLFGGFIGLFLIVGIELDGGVITYVSGGSTITVLLGTYGTAMLLLPVILCFLMTLATKH